jgi:sugar lactone lactonase YvrE
MDCRSTGHRQKTNGAYSS